MAKVPFLPRVAPLPFLTQGTTSPGTGRTEASPRVASQPEKKTQCRSLFLRTKGLCALLLELPPLPPGPPPNLQEGGQRAIFQRPPVYLGNKPTPLRREGSFGRSPKEPAFSPAGDSSSAPRPGPARRAAGGSDPGRTEGTSGEPQLRSRAARPPPVPEPGALSPASCSRARGMARPGPRVPGWRGGRGPESLKRQGKPEPWGSREGSASLPEPARTPGA